MDDSVPKQYKRKLINENLQVQKQLEIETKIKKKKGSANLSQEEDLKGETSNAPNGSGMSAEMEKQTRSTRKRKNIDDLNLSTQVVQGRLTDYEKIDLFNGLVQHGSSNISLLQSYLPNKNTEQVKQFLNSYKRAARLSLTDGKVKAPIDKWLEFLSADPEKERDKLFDLSRTLKYIALFEPRVDESESSLSECYKLLSDCMRGESPKHLNPTASLYLHEQLKKIIRIHKSQNYEKEHKHLENYNKKTLCYSGKKQAPDSISDPRISNPLKIPDSLLELNKSSNV